MVVTWAWLHLVGATGCRDVQNLTVQEGAPPTVEFEELEFKRVDFDRADAAFVLNVVNPGPAKLRVAPTEWTLELAGRAFGEGSGGRGTRIAAQDQSTVRIPVALRWREVLEVAGVEPGDDAVPYELRAKVAVETPSGEVTLPVHHEGMLPVLHPARLQLYELRLLGLQGAGQFAQLELDLELGTDQGTPVSFDSINYRVLVDGMPLASGQLSKSNVGQSSRLTVPLRMALLQLPPRLATAMRTGGIIDVRLSASSRVSTPLGVVSLDVEDSRSLPVQ